VRHFVDAPALATKLCDDPLERKFNRANTILPRPAAQVTRRGLCRQKRVSRQNSRVPSCRSSHSCRHWANRERLFDPASAQAGILARVHRYCASSL